MSEMRETIERDARGRPTGGDRGKGTRRRLLGAAPAVSAMPVALAVGCTMGAGRSGAGEQGAAPALKAGSTIVFWNDMTGAYPGLMQRWGDAFRERTRVQVEVTGGIAGYADKLASSFASGAPPDVFRYLQEGTPLPAAVERGMLLKLDAQVKRDKYDLSDFRKDAVELYRWKGTLYAIPRDYGLQLVYYNTEVFQREGLPPIPTDWNDKTWTMQRFVETCVRLARSGERHALFVPRGPRLWASFVYSNGGQVVKHNQEGLATEFALAERPAVEALQLMQDLIYRHKVAPEPGQEGALGTAVTLMQSGKLAMQITNPSANVNYLTAGMPYDVGVFPLGAASRRGVGGGGTGWAVAAPTKVADEAWAFVASITSREGQLGEVEIGQTTPSRVSVVTGKEYLDPTTPPAGKRVFADGQEYVVRDPVHSRWPDVQRDVVTKLLDQQLWTGQLSAAQVLKEVKEKGDPYFT
ncbi:MAG TPA: sugar ABC transporter substrate-binding protein [Chloroflexota bacterium]|nr:sugar ABC transporter substrate-binding protein [Chloroflexota bacterium]